MPSDLRLHPLSVFFILTRQVSGLLIPLLLVLIGAGSSGFGWELFGLLSLIPTVLVSVGRYLTFRYRYEPTEMVIRSGFLFRSERHVPYARIQNVEAVQNPLHRLLNVVEVRVQTGGADEPEATMTVVPMAALEEMRRRVAEGRQDRHADGAAPAREAAQQGALAVVLRLPVRELLLSGFIENRGFIVVGAAAGLLWELNLGPRLVNWVVGEEVSGRGAVRNAIWSLFEGAWRPMTLLWLAAGVVAFLLLTRVFSMGWAAIRLNGFTVSRENQDLRMAFGLLTRMTTTIPMRRIQQITIRETPLHRLFRRASVRVATAGGIGKETTLRQREWLAPIIRSTEVAGLLRELLPGVDAAAFDWQPVHPRAFRRVIKVSLLGAVLVALGTSGLLRWWNLWLSPLYLAAAIVHARMRVASLAWAKTDRAVAFRRGAFWRYVTIARFSKIQAVSTRESPFDRRTGMAVLAVDTAGASATYQVTIPYLDVALAKALSAELAETAGRTTFRW